MGNKKHNTLSIEEIKNIINDSITNATNMFSYEEFLQEITCFNMDCFHYEELLNEFLDTELNETSLDILESVTDNIELITKEYIGFYEKIVVLGCKDYSEIKEVLSETIHHCELITSHYTKILANLQLVNITCENYMSTIYGTIIEQKDFFNAVIFAISNINFKDKFDIADEITNLQSLDIEAKKRCIIRFNEIYGNIIYNLDFFNKNNSIEKIYAYIKNRQK